MGRNVDAWAWRKHTKILRNKLQLDNVESVRVLKNKL